MKKKYFLFLLLTLITTSLFANSPTPSSPSVEKKVEQKQETSPTPLPSENKEVTASFESNIGKMLFSLLGFFVLFILSIWFLKKLKSGGFKSNSYQKSIQILERKQISPKSTLYVIEAMGKKILISESQNEIRALTEVENEREKEDS